MNPHLTISQHAALLSRNARESMRFAAMEYRAARADGKLCKMVRWLMYASTFRDIAKGYLEAA